MLIIICALKKCRDIQIHFSTSLFCISISELTNVLLGVNHISAQSVNVAGSVPCTCSDIFALGLISPELFKTQIPFVSKGT